MQNVWGVPIPTTCKCKQQGSTAGVVCAGDCKLANVVKMKDSDGNILVEGVDYQYTSTGIEYLTDCSAKSINFICTVKK